jgi:hypothetical protein
MDKPRLHMVGVIVIDWNHFTQTPIYLFGKPLKEVGVALKVATGYQYDNEHFRVAFERAEFAFSILQEMAALGSPRYKEIVASVPGAHLGPNGGNAYTLRLWNFEGVEALFEKTFACECGSPLPADVSREAAEALRLYGGGIRTCSDCGSRTNANSGRHYFAGIYCQACWEGSAGQHKGRGGWKKVEANETYD